MRRAEVYWADLGPPAGRRPVVIVTRDAAIPVLAAITVAPVTPRIREIASEVRLGPQEGLDESVATCDNLLTVPKADLDPEPVGRLAPDQARALDEALRFALGISY